ncbi:MAG: hypothetical protein CMJ83_00490 [Planctomycetes bacterium]|nr:hypothetical protein [Planctomycetota bacterium]
MCQAFWRVIPALFIIALESPAQPTRWKQPPPRILEAVEAAATPEVLRSPRSARFLMARWERLLPLERLARPYLGLAGNRIDPKTYSRHAGYGIEELRIRERATLRERVVKLPKGLVGQPVWSGDGRRFAFSVVTQRGVELWVGDARTAAVKRMLGPRLCTTRYRGFGWNPDGDRLVVRLVPENRRRPAKRPAIPPGPNVQQAAGGASPVYTYSDLLRDDHDDALFRHYMGHELAWIDIATGKLTVFGKEAVYNRVTMSPDGRHLCVQRTKEPFLRDVPSFRFMEEIEGWRDDGTVLKKLHARQMNEFPWRMKQPQTLPHYYWDPLQPATLVWTAPPSGTGAGRRQAVLASWKAPFRSGGWKPITHTDHPIVGLQFLVTGELLVAEYDSKRRHNVTWLVERGGARRKLWDLPYDQWYGHPGYGMFLRLQSGFSVLRVHDGKLWLRGRGATPKGDRPFLDRLDLKTLESERVWQCSGERYEEVTDLLAADGSKLLISSETPIRPADWYELDLKTGKRRRVTSGGDPSPYLADVDKTFVTYARKDGVPLSATLYVPKRRPKGKRLPLIVWAYPQQYNSKKTAGEVVGSPHEWVRPSAESILWLTRLGYAVMDEAAIPVVSDLERANDRLVEEFVLGAKAAVEEAVRRGIADRDRVMIAGHSYGGFMVATLLAHTNLFRAGISRSGFFNTTLVPFGFQDERRTLWKARDVYVRSSPFMHADKIDEPLLLMHGEKDENGNCFPIQSERLFHAIKGCGGRARLVMLPFEGHAYRGKETIHHVLAETAAWCERWLGPADGPAPKRR